MGSSFLWPASTPFLLIAPLRCTHTREKMQRTHSGTRSEKPSERKSWSNSGSIKACFSWTERESDLPPLPLIHKHWAFPDFFPWATSLPHVPRMCVFGVVHRQACVYLSSLSRWHIRPLWSCFFHSNTQEGKLKREKKMCKSYVKYFARFCKSVRS